MAFFDQKHRLTPLKKCDLLDFEKRCFLQSKRFRNFSIISTLILTKSEQIKKMAFFDQKHGLTPLKKCVFLDFEKFCFLRSKKVFFFLCRVRKHYSRLILIKFKQRKKLAFFDQKHGLTRLEKCNFLDFEKFSLLMPKKVSFFPAKSESIISYDGPGGSQSNIGF